MRALHSIVAVTAIGLCGAASADGGVSIAVAAGTTGQGGMTFRVGTLLPWQYTWLRSDIGHLTGYWDIGYTWWESGANQSTQHSISLAPVLVYEFTGWRVTPFIEAGVGLAAFSSSRVGDRNLGSAVNFEDRIGFGVRWNRHHTVGVRAIHYSNAGFKEPNNGIESYSLYYHYAF